MATIDLSTCGIRVGIAHESTAGTKPSSFVNLPRPKSIPDMNPDPSALDTSHLNLEQGEFKTYIEGLKDMGGSLAITFGMSQDFFTTWETFVDTAATNKALGKRAWMVFYVPGLSKSFFMTVEPSMFGMPSAEVDAVLDVEVRVMPTGEIGWATAINPTDAASA